MNGKFLFLHSKLWKRSRKLNNFVGICIYKPKKINLVGFSGSVIPWPDMSPDMSGLFDTPALIKRSRYLLLSLLSHAIMFPAMRRLYTKQSPLIFWLHSQNVFFSFIVVAASVGKHAFWLCENRVQRSACCHVPVRPPVVHCCLPTWATEKWTSVVKCLTVVKCRFCRWWEHRSSCRAQDATQHLWVETTDWARNRKKKRETRQTSHSVGDFECFRSQCSVRSCTESWSYVLQLLCVGGVVIDVMMRQKDYLKAKSQRFYLYMTYST